MSQQKALTKWKEKDPFSASHLNEAWDMLRPLSNIIGGGGTNVTQFPNGTTIYSEEVPPTTSNPGAILRVSTSITFPATLGIGWYWAVVQQRNSTALDPTVNLSLANYYTDPAGATVVLLYNDVESGALIRTIPYANGPMLGAWKTGLTADVVPAAGPPAVTYDVYFTKGIILTC